MSKLTDTQLVILTAAAKRGDGGIVIPEKLRGGAAQKVVAGLLKRKLIKQVPATADLPAWREGDDGRRLALRITDAGLRAIGIEPESAAEATTAGKAKKPGRRGDKTGAPQERGAREGTKQALLIEMLRRKEGATVDQIAEATGWQRHTVRGAIAGALKKKLGLAVTSEKAEGGRVYKIEA